MWSAWAATILDDILCFGSPELDALCGQIGRQIAATDRFAPASGSERNGAPTDVHIASELYETGGHTPLIGDFISASAGRRAIVLVTNIDNRIKHISPLILSRLGLEESQVCLCPEPTLAAKAKWLKSALAELAPDRIFLFNHPHDAPAVAAAASHESSTLCFVHHVDRRPCLGAFLATVLHIDVTLFCFTCCRTKAGLRDNIFIPLTVPDLGCRTIDALKANERGLITAAAGGEYKFQLDYAPSYLTTVTELLRAKGRRHVHIGELSDDYLARFKSELREAGVPETSLIYVPQVPSVWQAMSDFDVDLYIGSFPVRGARTTVEVMGSGTPAVWHQSHVDTFFHDTHMKYPEAAVWRTTNDLFKLLDEIDGQWLLDQSRAARSHYEATHRPDLTRPLLCGREISGLSARATAADFKAPRLWAFDDLIDSGLVDISPADP
jgi:hypothetical protein